MTDEKNKTNKTNKTNISDTEEIKKIEFSDEEMGKVAGGDGPETKLPEIFD